MTTANLQPLLDSAMFRENLRLQASVCRLKLIKLYRNDLFGKVAAESLFS